MQVTRCPRCEVELPEAAAYCPACSFSLGEPVQFTEARINDNDAGRIGTTRPERYLAAACDNLLAVFLVIYVAAEMSERIGPVKTTAVKAGIGFGVLGVYFVYFLVFEALFSTTPGKLLCGLQVRRLDDSKCGFRGALIRTATRLLEVNPMLLGCLPAALIVHSSVRKQRWGDFLAGTIVVEKRKRRR